MKRRMVTLLAGVALGTGFMLSACGSSSSGGGTAAPAASQETQQGAAAETPAGKDTLSVVITQDPSNLDPNDSVSQTHHQVTRQIFETLVVFDKEGTLKPWLAESWEYENDTTLVFHLRKGITFQNGDELKASDVLFTIRRIKEQNLIGLMEVAAINIDKSEAVDDYTVKLVMDQPYAIQLQLMENPDTAIISERAYNEANGDFFNGAAVGTGPYKYVEYKAGDQITLTAYDNYWNQEAAPKIPNVLMRFITDSSSRAIEAESGGADIVYDISSKDVDRLKENPNINLASEFGTNTAYLTFNTAMAPLDNEKVREAIWYGVDVPSAEKMAFGNYGALAEGFMSPGIIGGSPNFAKYNPKRDVEKSKQLLAEAGYPDGLEIHISCSSSNQERCDLAEAFQAQLAEVGITLKIDVMEGSAWEQDLIAGNAQLSIYGCSATTFEAGRSLTHWLPGNSEFHIWSYSDPEFIDTLNKAFTTIDDQERIALYEKCQDMLMEHYVSLPVWHKEINAALSPNVEGFELTRSYEQHYLQYVSFK